MFVGCDCHCRVAQSGKCVLGKRDFVDYPATIRGTSCPECASPLLRGWANSFASRLKCGVTWRSTTARFYLIVHLGMTGTADGASILRTGCAAHTCLFALDDGRELRYTDPRRFGRMLLVDEAACRPYGTAWKRTAGNQRGRILPNFASQDARRESDAAGSKRITRCGQYLRGRSLFPRPLASRAHRRKLKKHNFLLLHRNSSRRSRGSHSFSRILDFRLRRFRRQAWEFQFRHRVYQRDGKPCFRCKTIIRRIIVAGRSSHFCPRCQPAPRRRKRARGD